MAKRSSDQEPGSDEATERDDEVRGVTDDEGDEFDELEDMDEDEEEDERAR